MDEAVLGNNNIKKTSRIWVKKKKSTTRYGTGSDNEREGEGRGEGQRDSRYRTPCFFLCFSFLFSTVLTQARFFPAYASFPHRLAEGPIIEGFLCRVSWHAQNPYKP
jgi:hypothetical protein